MLSLLRLLFVVRMLNGHGWVWRFNLLLAFGVFCLLIYAVVH